MSCTPPQFLNINIYITAPNLRENREIPPPPPPRPQWEGRHIPGRVSCSTLWVSSVLWFKVLYPGYLALHLSSWALFYIFIYIITVVFFFFLNFLSLVDYFEARINYTTPELASIVLIKIKIFFINGWFFNLFFPTASFKDGVEDSPAGLSLPPPLLYTIVKNYFLDFTAVRLLNIMTATGINQCVLAKSCF